MGACLGVILLGLWRLHHATLRDWLRRGFHSWRTRLYPWLRPWLRWRKQVVSPPRLPFPRGKAFEDAQLTAAANTSAVWLKQPVGYRQPERPVFDEPIDRYGMQISVEDNEPQKPLVLMAEDLEDK